MTFERGKPYRLIQPDRFDDDYGRGYDHAILSGSGSVPSDWWVHDAWIVNGQGRKHPGLNISPVPIRLVDLVDPDQAVALI